MKNISSISIIIIGYNTCCQLKNLLYSINQVAGDHISEVVYVDDGSTDNSFEVYLEFKLKYKKIGKKLTKNMGRSFATQKGIDLASGAWFFFVRSNEILLDNIILEYEKTINKFPALAYMGRIQYKSQDKIFEQYLNNDYRGVLQFKNGELINYKYLLFNNSIIYHSIFKKIRINQELRDYGGEELDFSYKLNQQYSKNIRACPSAVVVRKNYPSLSMHCHRLYEFGSTNFLHLDFCLKKDIVQYIFLLRCKKIFYPIISFTYYVCIIINKFNFKLINYYSIRIQMLCAILRGFYSGS